MQHRDSTFDPASGLRRAAHAVACAALLTLTTQASWSEPPAPAPASAPAVSGQPVYPSPEAAAQALFQAVQRQNHHEVQHILGAPPELLHTGQSEEDQQERHQFVEKYQQMHRLVTRTDGSVVLRIGAENWPFPVPLVRHNGGWRFDPDAGLREVLFRRIGENEITAIEVCHALAGAHHETGQEQPAQNTTSATDEVSGFLSTVLATAHGHHRPVRFHGYEYRVLPEPGNTFTAIAYPAAYRSSGVMTFAVGDDSVVYEKDLGQRTRRLARALRTFTPDTTWKRTDVSENP